MQWSASSEARGSRFVLEAHAVKPFPMGIFSAGCSSQGSQVVMWLHVRPSGACYQVCKADSGIAEWQALKLHWLTGKHQVKSHSGTPFRHEERIQTCNCTQGVTGIGVHSNMHQHAGYSAYCIKRSQSPQPKPGSHWQKPAWSCMHTIHIPSPCLYHSSHPIQL
eukprot:1161981-Pelagomonas_calceolata.AAC.7